MNIRVLFVPIKGTIYKLKLVEKILLQVYKQKALHLQEKMVRSGNLYCLAVK